MFRIFILLLGLWARRVPSLFLRGGWCNCKRTRPAQTFYPASSATGGRLAAAGLADRHKLSLLLFAASLGKIFWLWDCGTFSVVTEWLSDWCMGPRLSRTAPYRGDSAADLLQPPWNKLQISPWRLVWDSDESELVWGKNKALMRCSICGVCSNRF